MGDLIAKLIAWLKGLFGGTEAPAPVAGPGPDDRALPVMPRDLIATVLEECDLHAMEYSDTKRQLPCTFSIYLSEADFDFFYRANHDEVEGEIVAALKKLVQETGDRMKTPACILRIDSELSEGEYRVETSFDEVKGGPTPPFVERAETQRYEYEDETLVEDDVEQINTLYGPPPVERDLDSMTILYGAPFDTSLMNDTPVYEEKGEDDPISTPPLPVEPAIVAQVMAADGCVYEVHDGSVIGIVRNKNHEEPDIALHPTADLKYCSQRHGRFTSTDEGGFAYENLSGNGTVLMRGAESYKLVAGDEPIALESGDQLVLGAGDPAITFMMLEA